MEAARPATADDLDAIETLLSAAVESLRDQRGGTAWWEVDAPDDLREAVSLALDDDEQLVAVGLVDDVVVGVVVAEAVATRSARVGRIKLMVTDPRARGIGIGEAMIALVLGHCREHGCFGIDATALPGDRATKNFFETFGFTARSLTLHHQLS